MVFTLLAGSAAAGAAADAAAGTGTAVGAAIGAIIGAAAGAAATTGAWVARDRRRLRSPSTYSISLSPALPMVSASFFSRFAETSKLALGFSVLLGIVGLSQFFRETV